MHTQVFKEDTSGILNPTGETVHPHAYVPSEAVIVHADGYREPTRIEEIERRNRNRREECELRDRD
jgi:glycine/D-amino acid oxidase-like deaminating enzyme